MAGSWKPLGFKETTLSNNKAKPWTATDTHFFEKFIVDSMEKLKIPGASIAIIHKNGHAIYKKGFGVKQLGCNEQVTTDTLFMIGSITKPLTTFMMGMLVDRKKLSWETPVTEILHDFSVDDMDLTQRMNIRHSVSASTGMPQGGFECLFKSRVKPEDRLLEMRAMKPTTSIGETFQYSNYLVMAGGYAAAHAYNSEMGLEEAYNVAMKKMVFDPLAMKKTVVRAEEALQRGAALPHGLDFNGNLCEIPLHLEAFAYGVAPAGAIWSTVDDLSQYLLTEMNNGTLNSTRVITEAAL
jgi:CubicO group peptidase (beta-lactamase class C family)